MNCKIGARILYFLNFCICHVQDVSCTKHRVGEGISHHVILEMLGGIFLALQRDGQGSAVRIHRNVILN